jgi:hypothetical protein
MLFGELSWKILPLFVPGTAIELVKAYNFVGVIFTSAQKRHIY